MLQTPSWRWGKEVYAFYHANEHPAGYRYVRVFERTDNFPVIGITSGWMPAMVVDEADPDEDEEGAERRIRVFFFGTFRHPHEGYCEGMELLLPVTLVKPVGNDPPPQPLLSVVSFRWHDYWSNSTWSDYSVTNDGMLLDLFEGPSSMSEHIPGEYEVVTVFVRKTEDLGRIDPPSLRSKLNGRNITAWYFLWPDVRKEKDNRAGCVCERFFFLLCQRMERAAIRSCWPHSSHLYRLLCGKLWVPQMCLNRKFRVPPTTRMHYAEFRRHPYKAVSRVFNCLMRLRKLIWDKEPVRPEYFKGVVKLGFSWQGDDVLPFQGLESLMTNLIRLYEQPRSEQTICLVQEMIPGVVGEYRILCFHDRLAGGFHRERLWLLMKDRGKHHLHKCDVDEFTLASSSVVPPEAVAYRLFRGDSDALAAAELEAEQLVDRWLLWFMTECTELPQVTRIDFLVSHTGPGTANVWTCEVGECGASLCSVEVDARNVAALNNAVRQDASTRLPLPLPKVIRNNGWKS